MFVLSLYVPDIFFLSVPQQGCAVVVAFLAYLLIFVPALDKTYNYTCMTSKDSDQLVHLPSMAKVLVYYLNSLEAVEGIFDQRRLITLRGCAG